MKHIALVAITIIPSAALAARGGETLLVEAYKKRVFASLNFLKKDAKSLKKGKLVGLDKSYFWQQKIKARSVGPYKIGDKFELLNAKGKAGKCKIKSFWWLTRGIARDPSEGGSDPKTMKSPECGTAALFAELKCRGVNAKKLGKAVAVASAAETGIWTPTKKAGKAAKLAKRACTRAPHYKKVLAQARRMAKKKKAKLKTKTTITLLKKGEMAVAVCQAHLWTKDGSTECGADDVSIHTFQSWMFSGNKLFPLTKSREGSSEKVLYGVSHRENPPMLLFRGSDSTTLKHEFRKVDALTVMDCTMGC